MLVVALLMLSGGAVNAGPLASSDDAAPFGWRPREAVSAAALISDEDDCTQSTAARTTAAASGRCTRG
jgi:hypothetical protein